MNKEAGKSRNNLVKLLLIVLFVFLLIVGIFKTISSYEVVANNITIDGLVSRLPDDMIRVRFDSNGGNIDTIDKVVKVGDRFGTLPEPTRDGYLFDYWYFEDEDNKVMSSTTVDSNTKVLKAKWVDRSQIAILKEYAFYNYEFWEKYDVDVKRVEFYHDTPSAELLAQADDMSDETSNNKAYFWGEGSTLYYWSEYPIYIQNDQLGDYWQG